MNWKQLTESKSLDKLIQDSINQTIIIFKHSTRCHISAMVKDRLERKWSDDFKDIDVYFLDLIKFRNLSNQIAEIFEIEHQSPQLLIISNQKCIYNASHTEISVKEIQNQLINFLPKSRIHHS